MEIKNCVAIITGGASGLGEACARDLVKNKAKVSILDLDEVRGKKIATELGDGAIFCMTDVTDEKSVRAAIDKTLESFGSIQVVINCAGILGPGKVLGKDGPISLDLFNKVVQINMVGSLNVIRLAVEKMIKNAPNEDGERGVLINTSSIAAYEGQIGQIAYAASKAGVLGMMLPLTREFADYGIRVMTIVPGFFETPMVAGMPEKVRTSLIATVPFPKRLGKSSEYSLLVKHIIENPMLNGESIRIDAATRMAAK